MIKHAFIIFTLALLTACATPQSIDQRIAYAYVSHTAVGQATAGSLAASEIASTDAESIIKIADESRLVLDSARVALGAGDMQTAEGRLLLATGVLEQMRDYLRKAK